MFVFGPLTLRISILGPFIRGKVSRGLCNYVSRELSHLYGHSLHKKLVRGLRKPRTSISCHLYEQFAAYKSRGLCNPRLIFPRINGPIVIFHCLWGVCDVISHVLCHVSQSWFMMTCLSCGRRSGRLVTAPRSTLCCSSLWRCCSSTGEYEPLV